MAEVVRRALTAYLERSALGGGLALATRNRSDFEQVGGLRFRALG